MIHTSVSIAAGKTVTIPRSTDLVNSIWYSSYNNGKYYSYTDANGSIAGWYSSDNSGLTIKNISETTITVQNKSSSYSGTLYYSYAE